MNPVDNHHTASSSSITVELAPKQRIIKLVEAVALTVFSLGLALFSQSVRNLWVECWSGKKVVNLTTESVKSPSTSARTEPLEPSSTSTLEPSSTPPITEPLTFASLEEKTKKLPFDYLDESEAYHRFTNIPCLRETAIVIDNIYMHANRIPMSDGKTYIATQAPVPFEQDRFWKMAFQNSGCIVDITTPKDRTTGGVRAYHPFDPNEPTVYDGATVTLLKTVKITPSFLISSYSVEVNGEKKTIERLHFLAWKDFHGAELESLQLVIDHITPRIEGGLTPIIHCRAGVGRTGTLITILTLIHLHNQGILTENNLDATIEAVILKGRECRGPWFVQSKEQLETIIEYTTRLLQ